MNVIYYLFMTDIVNLNIELPSIDINSNICNQTIENKLENFNDLEKNLDNIDKVNLINNETIKPNYLCPLCCEELNIKYFNTCEVCQFKICQKCFKLYLKYDYTNCPHCRSKLKLKIKIPKHEIRNNFSTIDNSNIDIFNIYQNRLENDDRLPMACVFIIAILIFFTAWAIGYLLTRSTKPLYILLNLLLGLMIMSLFLNCLAHTCRHNNS